MKHILKSKTFWFNVLDGAGTLLAAAEGLIPPHLLPYKLLASAAINIALRAVTNAPVTIKRQ